MWPRIPVTILVSAHRTGTARAMVQPGCTACLRGGGCSFYFGYGQDACPAENFDYHSIATPQKNKICPHIETKCSVLPSIGAARLKVGYGYGRPWRHSFHALVAFHKTPFQYFTSQNHNSPHHNSEKFYFLK